MAIFDVRFSVAGSNNYVINAILQTDGVDIFSISGTANGEMIEGLSSAYNSSNKINLYFNGTGTPASTGLRFQYYDLDERGISFSAGTKIYNVRDVDGSHPYVVPTEDGAARSSASQAPDPVRIAINRTYNEKDQPVCFAAGTLIRTACGEVAVEELQVGDLAVTASGALRPVVWIGRRRLDAKGRALPATQQPVRIRAGAFGPGLPARDLALSPGHPVLVGADADGAGGHLVPAMCLINGTTVAREAVAAVTYWHVELDSHDILLAEGLPAESYFDMGDRRWFAGEDGLLFDPDFVAAEARGRCRPVAVGGPIVEAERARLSVVFANALGEDCAWDEAERFAWVAA